MDTKELFSLIENLEENIEDLEENLEPLLEAALSVTTKKLPVLDRAKLYVLLVYSIESLLFSYLRLHGVQAKEHPVFKELTRVKQYFEKIKDAEAGPVKPRPNLSLNKQAAGRIIKHALASNDKFDAERAERELREKLLAQRKLKTLEASMKEKAELEKTTPVELETSGSNDDEDEEEEEPAKTTDTTTVPPVPLSDPAAKVQQSSQKSRKRKRERVLDAGKPSDANSQQTRKELKKERKKKAKRQKRQAPS